MCMNYRPTLFEYIFSSLYCISLKVHSAFYPRKVYVYHKFTAILLRSSDETGKLKGVSRSFSFMILFLFNSFSKLDFTITFPNYLKFDSSTFTIRYREDRVRRVNDPWFCNNGLACKLIKPKISPFEFMLKM